MVRNWVFLKKFKKISVSVETGKLHVWRSFRLSAKPLSAAFGRLGPEKKDKKGQKYWN